MRITDRLAALDIAGIPIRFIGAVAAAVVAGNALINLFTAPTEQEQLEALLKAAKCFETVVVPGTTVTGTKDCPDPITFEKVEVSDGASGGSLTIKTWFRRNRECPFVDWKPELVASDGAQYGVRTTLGDALTPPSPDNPEQLTDTYLVRVGSDVPPGPATYRASIEYACADSIKAKEIVYYPDFLQVCILEPNGARPRSCGGVRR